MSDNFQFSRQLHVNTHKGKKRTNSSNRWIARHINDPYVSLAQQKGYRSRAAFKIIEINDQFKILKKGIKVLDLGAAPGSWSQVISKEIFTKKSINSLVAIDLIAMDPITGVSFIQGDIYDDEIMEKIASINKEFDLITSDIAPNTTGHTETDHIRIIDIAENILEIAKILLAKNGNLVLKIFQGSYERDFIKSMRQMFEKVKYFKPKSSRKESAEIYVIGQNFLYEREN